MPTSNLDPGTPVQFLKGVGPQRAALLAKLGIETVEDLVRHFPRDYQDRRQVTPIGKLRPETSATVRSSVLSVRTRKLRGRRSLVTAQLSDGTGTLEVEFWQQKWRAKQLAEGREVILFGRVTWDKGPKMTGPDLETAVDDDEDARLHADRIVPIHRLTRGISAPLLRVLIHRAIEQVQDVVVDPLPDSVRAERELPHVRSAVRAVHFPASEEAAEEARRRFKYEELFLLETALAVRRHRVGRETKPHRIEFTDRLDERIRARLPFRLTAAQDRVVRDIRADLSSPHPMNRLLQGDVGSGKTAVAVYAMLGVVAAGFQAALLAPTEILAEQHHRTLSRYLEGSRVRVGVLTGGAKAAEGKAIREAVALGDIDLVIGTHAIIQEKVRFARLALVVVDEQHKFGVMQRSALRGKGFLPDLLVMSATPIPRTLTMTLYGDLDLSLIDELPPGRQPVETVLCGEGDRAAAYEWIRGEIRKGRRVYHVVPLVEESEELPLKNALQHVEDLRAEVFPDVAVGLLHGRMSSTEKEAAMEAFRSGETPVLVCTTVVEVGVDVAEATVLVVEDAERFGLATLHQLRGRVGRGSHASRVILFHRAQTEKAVSRLQALEATTDGFKIAEEDLRLRGPGEVLGTRQHGLPELTYADLIGDVDLLADARKDAFALVARDPTLEGEGAPVLVPLLRKHGALLGRPEA